MKKWLVILLFGLCHQLQAQFDLASSTIKLGGGFAKDFPGLTGYALTGEYAHTLAEKLEGGFGIKRLNMSGYPRTATVLEFTKATTLDFNINFLPITNETSSFKIGIGYTFSFYKTRRSYPVIETHGTEKTTLWPLQDAKGRQSGITVSGEYEYVLSSNLTMGIKASLCKAYDRVFYIGPFLGMRL